MQRIQLFNVAPAIPPALEFLETLAKNLWWSWNLDAVELFRRINPEKWRESGHNPLRFLSLVPQKRLEALATDSAFLRHLEGVRKRSEEAGVCSPAPDGPGPAAQCVAYFSLEYGIHESVRLYSGGLGALAGDHLKSASDLNLPLVAVGLLYRQGYFQQYLNNDGWQQEHYPENEIHLLPVQQVHGSDGAALTVSVPLPAGPLRAVVWRLDVGRVPLYLLDTNTQQNPPELRTVTAQLYGGDRPTRLRQELLLGIGGLRALVAMGYEPEVCHLNEGHMAFVSLARFEYLTRQRGLSADAALEILPRTSVFTTHTPLPAGNETFEAELLRPHLAALEPELGLDPGQVLAWGRAGAGDGAAPLSMTILGLRMALFSNAVSRLHGRVARRMWSHLWPGKPQDELPIRYITNGIHIPSWLSPDSTAIYDRYLGTGWRERPGAGEVAAQVENIPDDELWRAHELNRSRLVRSVRELTERQLRARNATRMEITQAKSVLDHDALTIGFARRFTTYKRGNLVLRDRDRFEALLTSEERPVQIVFGGKAHPADNEGKNFIREIIHFARRPAVRRRVVFLEDYDLSIARRLVQGVDVWLNTPRRPNEASGTSGMKAAINGGIHVSIMDGWWCEGYSPECGWAIGHGEEYEDPEYQDTVESQALYNLLEDEVIPLFYERPQGDVPRKWIRMMKASVRMALCGFSSHRMVGEYEKTAYRPAAKAYRALLAENGRRAAELVSRRQRLQALWGKVRVEVLPSEQEISGVHVGDGVAVGAAVTLGELQPGEVDVEVYYGPVDSRNRITSSRVQAMAMRESRGDGTYLYGHQIKCESTGRYGFAVRAVPHGADWQQIMPGFLTWADGSEP